MILLWFFPLFLFAAPQATLTLDPIVKPSSPYYPGQKFMLGYEISYKGFVALTKEELPLLQGKGLENIGESVAETEDVADLSKQRFYQYYRAKKPGSYQFPTSFLEGVQYKTTPDGKKVPISDKMRVEVKPLTVEVLPFPEKDKPSSFEGALGSYGIALNGLKGKSLRVGEPFELGVTIKGEGDMDTVSFPSLFCQRGWGGFFSLTTPPKLVEKKEGEKKYILSLSPLSDEIKAIPKINFSSFDPLRKQYVEVSTEPMAVVVKPGVLPRLIQKKEQISFRLTPLSLVFTGIIAFLPYFYRSPFSSIAFLPFLINALILLFQ